MALTPAGNRFGRSIGTAQGRQPTGALPSDQCFEAGMEYRRFSSQTAQLQRLLKQCLIQDECGSHMHQYGA